MRIRKCIPIIELEIRVPPYSLKCSANLRLERLTIQQAKTISASTRQHSIPILHIHAESPDVKTMKSTQIRRAASQRLRYPPVRAHIHQGRGGELPRKTANASRTIAFPPAPHIDNAPRERLGVGTYMRARSTSDVINDWQRYTHGDAKDDD